MAVDNVGMDVPIKFGDSRSNGFRDIRGVDFASNERMNIGEAKPIPIVRNAKLKKTSKPSHINSNSRSC